MTATPLKVGCLGMGWWSDVLADAMQRSGKFEIVSCFTRSADKRRAFAAKYGISGFRRASRHVRYGIRNCACGGTIGC